MKRMSARQSARVLLLHQEGQVSWQISRTLTSTDLVTWQSKS